MSIRERLTALLFAFGLLFIVADVRAETTWYLEPEDIERVYDGDTFYIDLDGLPPVFGEELPVRFLNIDTPEIRSRCKDDAIKDEEKRRAIEATDFLTKTLAEATEIRITHLSRGSFFRVVADVYVDGVWLNELMVETGHAVPALDKASQNWCQIIADEWAAQ